MDQRSADTLAALHWTHGHLADLFGAAALPVFVPPWNRLDDAWLPDLAACGFTGLSRFGPRAGTGTGLRQANTHVDPVDWRGGKGFVGTGAALGVLTGHLRGRRTGTCDEDEPTGLLTHHLVQDTATWEFIAALFARTAGHGHVTWLPGAAVFAHTGRDGD